MLLFKTPYIIAAIPPTKQPIYKIAQTEKTTYPKELKQNDRELSNFLHLNIVTKILIMVYENHRITNINNKDTTVKKISLD